MRVPIEKFVTEIKLILGVCQCAGQDGYNNHYYEDACKKRWVIYKGTPEGSKVPPLWNAWLHHTVNNTPVEKRYGWERPPFSNISGTSYAYKAHSNMLETLPYEPWSPQS